MWKHFKLERPHTAHGYQDDQIWYQNNFALLESSKYKKCFQQRWTRRRSLKLARKRNLQYWRSFKVSHKSFTGVCSGPSILFQIDLNPACILLHSESIYSHLVGCNKFGICFFYLQCMILFMFINFCCYSRA